MKIKTHIMLFWKSRFSIVGTTIDRAPVQKEKHNLSFPVHCTECLTRKNLIQFGLEQVDSIIFLFLE